MNRALHYIVSAGVAAGAASMLYFLCLVIGLAHLAIAVPLVLSGAAAIFWWARRSVPPEDAKLKRHVLPLLILAAGMAVLLWTMMPLMQKYGGWDAWAMWNFHAKFLRSPQFWTMMFDNGARAHPDYPLFIPSLIAFASRICRCPVETASFVLHLAITIAIPSLIFLRYQAKNLPVATAALFLMVTDKHYVEQGVSMYADTALPFFILCALLCLHGFTDRRMGVLFAALALGCCAWTKNEGLMLTAVFVLLYFRELFAGGNAKFFALGAALPLLTLAIFKGVYAPANDMLGGLSPGALRQLTDVNRYRLIFVSVSEQAGLHFAYMKYLAALLIAACIVSGKWPDRNIAFVLIALAVYVLTYALTYLDLEWHLHTSMERLLHQLMPVAVYSIAGSLADVHISLPAVLRRK